MPKKRGACTVFTSIRGFGKKEGVVVLRSADTQCTLCHGRNKDNLSGPDDGLKTNQNWIWKLN